MAGNPIGTRVRQNFEKEHPATGRLDRSFTRDLGLVPNVSASVTFVASPTSQAQAANGTFPAGTWPVGMVILVIGSVLNSGEFVIVANDPTNGAFLTLDNPPKAEGPIQCTFRSK